MKVRVEIGDITAIAVDAIVNAANERLLGGGGVDGAIHDAAGPRLLEACCGIPEVSPGVRCPTGQARITPAFELPARFVVHTVGPVWRGGERGERELLASCYRSVFALCARHAVNSVAFPAISCGVFGFPIVEASQIATREMIDAIARRVPIESVRLVAFDPEVYSALSDAARAAGLAPD